MRISPIKPLLSCGDTKKTTTGHDDNILVLDAPIQVQEMVPFSALKKIKLQRN